MKLQNLYQYGGLALLLALYLILEVVVGLYDFTSGVRLPLTGSADDAILLDSFEVGQ